MEQQEFALECFKNTQELIRFVDQKSGAVLVVSGLILTVFLEISKALIFQFQPISWAGFLTFLFGTTTTLLLIYVIYISIFKILRPRLAKHYAATELSLLYFNHLAQVNDKSAMFMQFKKLDDDVILQNITDQVFEISKILDNKIIALHHSMNFLFYAVASLLFFILTSRLI